MGSTTDPPPLLSGMLTVCNINTLSLPAANNGFPPGVLQVGLGTMSPHCLACTDHLLLTWLCPICVWEPDSGGWAWDVPKTSCSCPLGHEPTPPLSEVCRQTILWGEPARFKITFAISLYNLTLLCSFFLIRWLEDVLHSLSCPGSLSPQVFVVKFELYQDIQGMSSIKPNWEKQLLSRTLGTIWKFECGLAIRNIKIHYSC